LQAANLIGTGIPGMVRLFKQQAVFQFVLSGMVSGFVLLEIFIG
jgi:hypothetical protein